ncbi:DddA-like double-stranded DNA deaminase toxin [Amycolatopsis sp. cg5]|uniref:DddA-like double-stranded DNA deaminase toxin n=1 Tax=Amycolatopsis sp. cg5 TaxID=3238802 RepID=UPI0035259758
MDNVEAIAAAVRKAINAAERGRSHLEKVGSLLSELHEQYSKAFAGSTNEDVTPLAGDVERVRVEELAPLITRLVQAQRDLEAYASGLTGPSPAEPQVTRPKAEPDDRGRHGVHTTTEEPDPVSQERLDEQRAELPPPVIKNSGAKTHGRWAADDDSAEFAPIKSGMKDDMYKQTAAHLESIGMGQYAIASHVEPKLAVHMAQTGLTNVVVTINNTPCLRHEVACVKWMHRYGGPIMSEV